jgi:hypothetical protein
MDLLDEELIRGELAGVNVDELVYEFPLGGKTVTGLTVYGTLAMGRLAVDMMPNIEIKCDEPKVEKRENGFKATCRVTYRNLKTGSSISFPGTKFQSKDITNKEGKVVKENDPNAETIAEMKAMRNGLLKIFPPKKSAEFLNQFRTEGKIKRLSKDETEEALAKAQRRGAGPAKPAAKSGRKVIKYFQNSKKQQVKIPAQNPLYGEFENWCAALKGDHLDVEYKIKKDDESLDGSSAVSVTWENIPAGGELEKSIDVMMTSIADGAGA